jgi:DNA-binding transcriptional LysR family regulator
VLDIEDFPIQRSWYILQRKGKRISPAAKVFRDFVLAEASKFIRLPQ